MSERSTLGAEAIVRTRAGHVTQQPVMPTMQLAVPFLDLPAQYHRLKGEIQANIGDVLDAAAYISGRHVAAFEKAFAKAHHAQYCLGLSSGTDALHLGYWALGLGITSQIEHGVLREAMDEVIVPVNTYIATSETVSLLGARPVFVDQDRDSFNIDVRAIEERITPRTRAIVAVHLYGQPADMEPVLALAARHGLVVIEDCSQAHLAQYKGRFIGTFGRIGTFSFYPGKNLGAYGEAGAVVTDDEALYEAMLRRRQHGAVAKYVHEVEGHNYRMDELQAVVLWTKLRYLPEWTERRRDKAALYNEMLAGVEEVETPREMAYARHVYHLYVIRARRRDALQAYLRARGVETGLHYPVPLHLQRAYAYLGYPRGTFPVAERAAEEILSLPLYPDLTEAQITYVSDAIRSFYVSD